jgi:short-subunit dehydrogenase
MRARGSGELVLFASTAGWIPAIGMGAYCASKFAVVAFAEILAEETRSDGIRVLCVCPPPVDTPLLADLCEGSPIGKGLERVKPTPAAAIIDAIDRTLPKRATFVFPKAKTLWRLRRFAPRLSWRLFYWATASRKS